MRTANIGYITPYMFLLILLFTLVSQTSLFASSIVEFTAIGKIESLYKNRASMKVLHILASNTENLNVATGSWISFDIPKGNVDKGSRREKQIDYGNVVEVSLIGNVATEYEIDDNGLGNQKFSTSTSDSAAPNVLMWTAQSCKKVKNPNDYLPESEKKDKKGRKKNKKEKEKEPVKIWTQEETVRGIVLVKNEKVYIKEDRLGKRDKGLEILSEEWDQKLKELPSQKVVIHGITHRTGIGSGTMDVHNVLKVYPK